MKVLLIWEMFPEKTDLYLIENPSKKDLAALRNANGNYVGGDDDGSAEIINDMLSSEDDYCCTPGVDTNCQWKDYKVTEGEVIEDKIDMVFRCGFYL
jgi:hypothetical protein